MDKIFRSLKSRLISALAATVALLAVVVLAGWRVGLYSAYAHLEEHFQGQVGLRTERFSQDLQSYHNDLLFLASVPPIQGIVRASGKGGFDVWENSTRSLWIRRLNAIFSSYMYAHPEVFQLRYIGVAGNGRELVRVNRQGQDVVVVSNDEMQAKGDRRYFRETVKLRRHEIYISDIDLNRENGAVEIPHIPTIRMATPIRNTNGDTFGIVVINIKAKYLLDKLRQNLPEGVQVYLTNLRGDFLIHPDPGKTFGFDFDKSYRWENEFQPLANNALPSALEYFAGSDGHIIAMQRRIPFQPDDPLWGLNLILVTPEENIEIQVLQSVFSLLIAVIACIAVAGGFLYLYWLNNRQKQKVSVEQARLAAIVESTDDAVIGNTLNGVVLSWNRGAEEMFGYSQSEATGQRLGSLIVPEDRAHEEKNILEIIGKGEKVPHFDTRRKRKDGLELDVSVAASPIKDAGGTIVGSAKTIRDISRQKAVEEEIRHLNSTLEQQVVERTEEIRHYHALQKAILNHAGFAIIATDREGFITLFNPAAERMLGYSAEEMIDRQTPRSFCLEEELSNRAVEFSKELGKQIAPGDDVIFAKSRHHLNNEHEWTYIRKDGSHFQVYLSVTMLADEDENISGYLLMASDISSQVQDRLNLMRMRDHLVKAAEVAELGIWTWNLEDDSLEWNQQMQNIYQVPRETLESGLYYEFWENSLHPEDRDATLSQLKATMDGEDVFDPTFRIVRPDGSTRYIQATAVVERDADNQPVLVLGVNRDITDRRAYETRLQEAKLAADKANKSKSEFLANMSHEIRTPMNAILGMLHLLKNTSMEAQQADYVEKTESAARALLGILNDILDFSKVEAGKLELDPQPCNIDSLLREVGVILSANVGDKALEVLFDIDPDLPDSVLVDGMRLQQVLINLAGNAVKFTESGEVVLSVKTFSRTENMLILSFSVRDTGIGISEEYLQRIFEGFSQAETSTARRYGGTGLGLTICQRLVSLMGGDLSAQSEEGKGSTFSFYIPCTLIEEQKLHIDGPLQNLKVLIVDDNASARDILGGIVTSLGWQVDTVSSGEEAIQKVQDSAPEQPPYDLILMDWLMPGIDGWEASESLRDLFPADRLPLIIMITAQKREALAQHQMLAPDVINGFLIKPVTASVLLDAVAGGMAGNQAISKSVKAQKQLRLQGLSILLVEDNPTNQQVALELLKEEGAEVDLAVDGVKAVDMVKSSEASYDVVLMDIQMPGMDGYTATGIIREQWTQDQLPIIAMTANAMESDRKAALDCGMNDHIGKPFNVDQLIDVILHHSGEGSVQPPVSVKVEPLADVVLDRKGALARLQGNEGAYQKALDHFLRDTPSLIECLVSGENGDTDIETLQRMVHSIKGGAATIGANKLSTLAQHIEGAIVEDGSMERCEVWLGDLQWQFNMVQEEVEKVVERSVDIEAHVQMTESVSQKDLGEELITLEGLLKEANLQALDVFEGMKGQYSVLFPHEFEILAEAMERMDFDVALACCRNVQRQVEESA
ncbi:PAS domain S-box protein [Hahella ganghwensis]|uniref:PAS domain S-box protein n=1 Tax=Hahella ganghwensis TaxID=286420 RepID=UPI00037C50CC|nr:PAS domain S-box protein [Hahella ganghwensis]